MSSRTPFHRLVRIPGVADQQSFYRHNPPEGLLSGRMGSRGESNEFKIGDLVRKIGDDQVGEVVSVGEDGLFVRYKNDSAAVTFYPPDLVERVKTSLEP